MSSVLCAGRTEIPVKLSQRRNAGLLFAADVARDNTVRNFLQLTSSSTQSAPPKPKSREPVCNIPRMFCGCNRARNVARRRMYLREPKVRRCAAEVIVRGPTVMM